jgi:hypothetical protein
MSSMIPLGTGASMYARTERRVFNASIASMAVCPPIKCWLQVAAHPNGESYQHLGNRHSNSVKGLALYKTGQLGIIALLPSITLPAGAWRAKLISGAVWFSCSAIYLSRPAMNDQSSPQENNVKVSNIEQTFLLPGISLPQGLIGVSRYNRE